MRLMVYSVYDKAVQAFLPPFHARSKGEALRSFTDACNNKEHQFFLHSSDYSLMFLGEFDDQAGTYSAVDPVRIVGAYECIADDPVVVPGDNVRRMPM